MRTQTNTITCHCLNPRFAAVALGRWAFGVLFLVVGLAKLGNVNGFADNLVKQFDKTWLPQVLVSIFGHVLPFLEIALGALLVLGLFRNVVLFATGILLLALSFGQMLLGQAQVMFFNITYLFLVAALLFLAEFDRWVIFPRVHRDAMEPDGARERGSAGLETGAPKH